MKIVSISITEENLNIIEKFCAANALNRSLFFIKSALEKIGVNNNYEEENQSRVSNETERKPDRNGKSTAKQGKRISKSDKIRNKKRNSGSSAIPKTPGKSRQNKATSRNLRKGEAK
jgi:hypothetical protein